MAVKVIVWLEMFGRESRSQEVDLRPGVPVTISVDGLAMSRIHVVMEPAKVEASDSAEVES